MPSVATNKPIEPDKGDKHNTFKGIKILIPIIKVAVHYNCLEKYLMQQKLDIYSIFNIQYSTTSKKMLESYHYYYHYYYHVIIIIIKKKISLFCFSLLQ